MPRLIDADALKGYMGCADAVKYGNKTAEQQHNSYSTIMMYEVADYIEDMPTIDAETVVRCKDCMYYIKNPYYDSEGGRAGYCEKIAYIMDGYYRGAEDRQPDDYCSQGERIKDGGAADGE